MPDYTRFSVQDFINDEHFVRWVLKKDPEDNAFWESWLGQHALHTEVVAEARLFVEELQRAHESISEAEVASELKQLHHARMVVEMQSTVRRGSWRQVSWYAAAAVVVGLVAGSFFWNGAPVLEETAATAESFFRGLEPTEEVKTSWVVVANDGKTVKEIALPDGSQVRLSAGSRISYAKDFAGETRDVHLVGEAFFEVTHRPEQPFLVHANELLTKVLGTSFSVRAFENDKDIQVKVKTGRVALNASRRMEEHQQMTNELNGEIILTANQQAIYDRSKLHFERSLVDNPEPVVADNVVPGELLLFERTPIAAVFDSLYSMYQIPILFNSRLLMSCELTAALGGESFHDKLQLICRAINAQFEVENGEVRIYGGGCQ